MNKSEIKKELLKRIKVIGRSYNTWIIRVGEDKFSTDNKESIDIIKKIRHQINEVFK